MNNLNLQSVKNARMIAGYKIFDGRCIKDNILLRSANLNELSEVDKDILVNQYNLKTIIDLRSEIEIEKKPDMPIDGVESIIAKFAEGRENKVMPSKYGSQDLANNIENIAVHVKTLHLESQYSDIVDSELGKIGLTKFFDCLLAHKEGSILWHCTAGKDRGGLAALLLMLALGTDLEVAIHEFELSNEAYLPYRKALESAFKNRIEEEALDMVLTYIAGVSTAYMQNALELIESKYGGVDNYLTSQLGLTEEKRIRLRDLYTM